MLFVLISNTCSNPIVKGHCCPGKQTDTLLTVPRLYFCCATCCSTFSEKGYIIISVDSAVSEVAPPPVQTLFYGWCYQNPSFILEQISQLKMANSISHLCLHQVRFTSAL